LDGLLHDIRQAWRQLWSRPGLTVVVVLTLALGMGANTAIFSAVRGVLLRPLPYESPDRLVVLQEATPTGASRHVSYPNFADWRSGMRSLEGMAAVQTRMVTLSAGDGSAERVLAALASQELFEVLGVSPALGRTFLAGEDVAGGEPVIVLGNGLWRRRFGADSSIVGRPLRIDGEAFTVIGVMPPGFEFPRNVEIWAPLGLVSGNMTNRAVHTLLVVGRLRPQMDLARAADELEAIATRVQARHPGEDPGHLSHVVRLHDLVVGDVRPVLLVLLGAVVFLLLIACTNVADILLARSAAREREMAVRAALGAGRSRLLRQVLLESVLLALVGGTLGVALAFWGLDLLTVLVSPFVPRAEAIQIDGVVLAFTLAVSMMTGLLFGIWPAVRSSRAHLVRALHQRTATATPGGARRWERRGLAAAQMAISLVLLVGAGLMVKSLWRIELTDLGFTPENLLTMTVSLAGSEYDEADEVIGFYRELRRRLDALPGVNGVTGVNVLPVSGGDARGEITVEGSPLAPGEEPGASFRRVLPGYFKVAGIPLRQGRDFDERDGGGDGNMVVIVSQSMARRLFPDGDVIGRRIKIGPAESEPWLTIIGVAGDVRNAGLDVEPGYATYEPHAQRPWRTMNVLLRTAGDPHAVVDGVRREIRELGGGLPVYDIATMPERIARSLLPRRLQALLLGIFAGVAVVLAAVGLYGVVSYTVGLRAREFGVRLAVGASPADLARLVLREGLLTVGAGALVGLGAALLLTRLLTGLLYEVNPADPIVLAAVVVGLGLVGTVASFVPVRRAALLQPMAVLRDE